MRTTVLAVFATATLLAMPSAGASCSCTGPTPVTDALAAADVVFRGQIAAVEPGREWWLLARLLPSCGIKWLLGITEMSPCVHEGHRQEYWDVATFRVSKVWKGSAAEELTVRTYPGGGNACGLPWRVGDTWVVYAFAEGPALFSHTCTRSRWKDAAIQEGDELDVLETTQFIELRGSFEP